MTTTITSKTDLARWVRAHEEADPHLWSVQAGPGGTMIITEEE